MTQSRLLLILAAALAVVLSLTVIACGSSSSSSPDEDLPAIAATVHIVDGRFDPRDLDIEVGGTVMWINDDVASHDLQFIDTPKLYSGVMKPTKSWIHTFDRVGTYEYYCDFHNTLKGTVVVHAAP